MKKLILLVFTVSLTTPALAMRIDNPVVSGALTLGTSGLTEPLSAISGGTETSYTSKAKLASNLISSLPRSNMRAVPLGDSITAGANGVNSGVPSYNNSGDYIGAALAAAGGRFSYLANAGVAGETCSQIRARVPAVVALNPHVVPLLAGSNDMAPIHNGTETYAQLMNCMEGIVTELLDAGILPVMFTLPPKNAETAEVKKARWFYYKLAQHYGIPLIDLYAIWANPLTGNWISSPAYTSDNVHPNAAAIAAATPTIATALANLAQFQQQPYFGVVAETAATEVSNLLVNGNFARQTTPPTPDTWSINSTGATLTAEAAAYPYNGQTFIYTKAEDGAVYGLSQTGPTVASGSIAVGDTMYFAAKCTASGLAYSATAVWLIEALNATPNIKYRYHSAYNGEVVFSGTFVIPATTTSVGAQLYTTKIGAYACNNFTLVDVTKMNVIWQPGQQGL